VSVQVVSRYSSAEQATDLLEQAKKLGSRKIVRFLDVLSLPPFVAAATVYQRNPVAEPEHVALYTVSGWDGDMPDQPFVPDGTGADDARLSKHILEDANPVGWLRMLANNALCQVSIAQGYRGPNTHFAGGAPALGHAIATAAADLRRDASRLALVVAFDPVVYEHRLHPSARAATKAAAIAIVRNEDGADELPSLLRITKAAAEDGHTALQALETCLSADLATAGAVR
jgi:hypothetical protein